MLFNSFEFVVFFIVVTTLFYVTPNKYRWILLLGASCVFYMWFVPKYILILFTTIVIDYIAGIYIEKSEDDKRRKKTFLIVSIVSTCLVLFIFKYLVFINQNIISLSQYFGFYYPDKALKIILPIGLSFHTFQSLSYVIEVYRGHQKAEKHFGIYSLYVMFYPQLVTGPIERPQNLLRQLHEEKKFQYDNIIKGLRLILFGMFVKMVIADNLATYIDPIYEDPSKYNSLSILRGIFFYAFQIYCDFFGYSTIALGCAKAMGYDITDNFRNPYLSKNIGEFWHRWHISLSTWFRDYVYIPLGGNRVKLSRWIFNIMVVFVLSGIWHGANWTFLIWGAVHGILLIIENRLNNVIKIKEPNNKTLGIFYNIIRVTKTFVLVSFLWMIFRAPNIHSIYDICVSMVNNIHNGENLTVDYMIYLYLGVFIIIDILLYNTRFDKWCDNLNIVVRWIIYAILIFMTIVFANIINYPFIYFQF